MSGNELEWALRNRIEELERELREVAELATPPDHGQPGVKLDAIYDKARAVLEKGKQPSAAGQQGFVDAIRLAADYVRRNGHRFSSDTLANHIEALTPPQAPKP